MTSPILPTLRGNFVLLRAGELRLLLPQEDVGAAAYLEKRPQAGSRAGLMTVPDDGRQFVALSSHLTLLPECPPQRFVVTPLNGDAAAGDMAWCWDELQVLIGVELRPLPLPVSLLGPGTPVDRYVEDEDGVAFVCDAARLQRFALPSGASA